MHRPGSEKELRVFAVLFDSFVMSYLFSVLFAYPHFLSEQMSVTVPSLANFLTKKGSLHSGQGVSSISPKTANLHLG